MTKNKNTSKNQNQKPGLKLLEKPKKERQKHKVPTVVVPLQIEKQLEALLSKYPYLEWSGPMWFSYTTDEWGLPEVVTIEHFFPIDLGTSGHTEWEDEHIAPHVADMLKDPEIGEKMFDWVRGNVHSHHNMKADFSGTDEGNILLNAPEQDFYFSLIVNKKRPWGFGFSYLDQYKIPHWYLIEKYSFTVIKPKMTAAQKFLLPFVTGMEVRKKEETKAYQATMRSVPGIGNQQSKPIGTKKSDPKTDNKTSGIGSKTTPVNNGSEDHNDDFTNHPGEFDVDPEVMVLFDDKGIKISESVMDVYLLFRVNEGAKRFVEDELIEYGYTLEEMIGYEKAYHNRQTN